MWHLYNANALSPVPYNWCLRWFWVSDCVGFGSQEEAICTYTYRQWCRPLIGKKDWEVKKVINTFRQVCFQNWCIFWQEEFSDIVIRFFASWFLSFLYWLLLFCIVHPFVWIICKTAIMFAWYGWPHVLPPLEGVHTLCPLVQNVLVMQVWK